MAKKTMDFTVNSKAPSRQEVMDQISSMPEEKKTKKLDRIPRGTEPTEEQIQIAREQGMTRGRKGMKMQRITMCFDPDVYDFIKVMGPFKGSSAALVNYVIRKYIDENEDARTEYETIKAKQQNL